MSAPKSAMQEIESRLADVEATTAVLGKSNDTLREALHSLMWAARELLDWGQGSPRLADAYRHALEVAGSDELSDSPGGATRPLDFREPSR